MTSFEEFETLFIVKKDIKKSVSKIFIETDFY